MSCNVVFEYINFSRNNINEYIKMAMKKKYDKEMFLELIKTYIDVRYYNLYENNCNTFEANINYHMKEKTLDLMAKNEEKRDIIKLMFGLFKFVLYMDNVINVVSVDELVDKICNYLDNKISLDSDFEIKLKEMLKNNEKRKKVLFDSFDNKDFFIVRKKTNIKKLYNVSIDYNLHFPKLYSEYAINKVFNGGIISEDKLYVEYYLISDIILKQIIDGNFSINYLIDFNADMIDKKNKMSRLLNIIDSDIVKDKVNLKIKYCDFKNNKDYIYDLIKDGYKFAIILDDSYNSEKISQNKLQVFSYILTNNKKFVCEDVDKIVICD